MTRLEWITTTPVDPKRKTHRLDGKTRPLTAEHIVCKDGTTLSVQANQYAYCVPEDNQGPWTKVEVGRLTTGEKRGRMWIQPRMPRTWAKYDTGGVYGRVPVTLVRAFIKTHGGEAIGARNRAVEA